MRTGSSTASPHGAPPLDPDEAWTAVATRDAAQADRFLYAVVTTGIYCRPGCASRRPRREHVRYFRSSADAEAAGFRPCKRCRPDGERPSPAHLSVERARAHLDARLDETVTLEELAQVARMSPFHLQRTFRHHTGLTPREYVQARRMERLREGLRAGATVNRAVFEAGWGSASRAYDQADAHLGMTPGAYRNGGAGVRIRHVLGPSRFGWVLVGATPRGVCAVALGDDPEALVADLRAEFPRADLAPADGDLHGWVGAIVSYLHGTARLPELPLDLQASAFRWRVWRALQEIPAGETRSYREVAERIGAPGSARAVARACAANPVAVMIPCHRVRRSDGGMGGYRWGVERKIRLLALEAGVDGP